VPHTRRTHERHGVVLAALGAETDDRQFLLMLPSELLDLRGLPAAGASIR
jgi:hypothetical protein